MQCIKVTITEAATTDRTRRFLGSAQYSETPVLLQANAQIKTAGVEVYIKRHVKIPFFISRFILVRDYSIKRFVSVPMIMGKCGKNDRERTYVAPCSANKVTH